ncbi:MAG TPA: acireductone dioxygenase [Cyanobacteria bacterium UBA8156]|nr:acireductone dioxygenase [Cyanobacteria bacterium UBA8156]
MAVLTVPAENRRLTDSAAIERYLAQMEVGYACWGVRSLPEAATSEDILAAYGPEIDQLKAEGGYVTADVVDVKPDTPGLEGMLAKFNREHWHAEDEVRFVVAGRGLFHLHPETGPVVAVEVGPGDLLVVPQGTRHWFDLCGDRRIRAIRLFQEVSGWTPHYTESGAEQGYQPLCAY